jgi:hypothetical protein
MSRKAGGDKMMMSWPLSNDGRGGKLIPSMTYMCVVMVDQTTKTMT